MDALWMEEESLPFRLLIGDEEESNSSSSSSSNPTDAVLFVGICLVVGIACRHLLRGTRVPYTVALLVIGIALGSIGAIFFTHLTCAAYLNFASRADGIHSRLICSTSYCCLSTRNRHVEDSTDDFGSASTDITEINFR